MLLLKWQKGRQPRRLLCFSAAFFIAALVVSLLFVRREDLLSICLLSGAIIMALIVVVTAFLKDAIVHFLPLLAGLLVGWLWCCGYLWLIWQPTQYYDNLEGHVRLALDEYAEGMDAYGVAYGTVIAVDSTDCRLKVKVYLSDGSPDYEPGDVLSFQGKFNAVERNWRSNLLQEGYFLTLSQKGDAQLSRSEAVTLLRSMHILSRKITLQIKTLLPGDEGSLLSALLSGDRSGFSAQFDRALTRSGLRHMTAVSGLHVSVLAGFLIWLLGKRVGLLVSVPLGILYAAITGFSPSVIRATVLLVFWSASFWLKEEKDSLTSLASALLLLTACNPFICMSAGLLLSFSATLGLILLSAQLNEVLVQPMRKITNQTMRRIMVYVGSTAAATMAATLFTLPLSILFFESVPLLSLLSNILVMWAVMLTMVLGIAVLLISLLLPVAAAKLATGLLFWPLHWIVRVICWIGELPYASTDSANMMLALAAVGVLVAVLLWRGKLFSGRHLLACTAAVLCLTVAFTAGERMLFGIIEIQNRDGQSIIAIRGDGISLLNCGSDSIAATEIAQSAMSRWNVSGLKTVICSSDDYKTQGGLAHLLDQVKVENVLVPAENGVVSARYQEHSVSCFSEGGSIETSGVTIQLLKAEEQYATRLWTKHVSLLDLSGLKPEQALYIIKTYPCDADLLLIAPSLLHTWTTFEQVRTAASPKEILLLSNRYSEQEQTFYHNSITELEWGSVQYRFLR